MSGVVYIREQKVMKPSETLAGDDEITVRDAKPYPYVSRGGLKLEKALKRFGLDVSGHDGAGYRRGDRRIYGRATAKRRQTCNRCGRRVRTAGFENPGGPNA